MSNTNKDILDMLDVLNLPECSKKFDQMLGDPALGSYSPIQFLREVLQPQCDVVLNKRFDDNLRKSGLIETDAKVENLRTGNGRVYNDTTVQQILSFRFAEDRKNVGVFGKSGVGKSYFLAAFCVEACRLNYSCRFVDYCELLEELITLDQSNDKSKYSRRLRHYAKYQLLFIDDFGISRFGEDGMKILYHLIKMRTEQQRSTLFSSQYHPEEWGSCLGFEQSGYGKVDGIRRRLTSGYTVVIDRAN